MDFGSVADWLALVASIIFGVISVYVVREQLSELPFGKIKKLAIRVLAFFIVAFLVWGTFQLGRWSSETSTVEVTRIPEQSVPATVEIEVTREVTRVVQQEVEVEVTREVPVEITRLVEIPVEITRLVEITAEGESNNSSENDVTTPTPLSSEPAGACSIETGFFDDFSNGISEEIWRIENGNNNFSIVDGQLVASGDFEISVGDETCTDYVVEVNIANALTFVTRGNYVGIRRTNTSMVAVGFAESGESQIYLFENGNWSSVPNSKFINPRGEKTLRIEVEGNNLSVFYNGVIVKSILINNISGKVSLKIGNSTKINWISITPIQ